MKLCKEKVNLLCSNLLSSHNDSLIPLKLLDYVQFTLTMLSLHNVNEFLRKLKSSFLFLGFYFWLHFPDLLSHGAPIPRGFLKISFFKQYF